MHKELHVYSLCLDFVYFLLMSCRVRAINEAVNEKHGSSGKQDIKKLIYSFFTGAKMLHIHGPVSSPPCASISFNFVLSPSCLCS